MSIPGCLNKIWSYSFDVDRGPAKACGYVPGVGIYIGIKRIAEAFFPQPEKTPLNTTAKVFKMIRGAIEIAGAGMILIPFDLFSWALRVSTNNILPNSISPPPAASVKKKIKLFSKDSEILENLKKQGFCGTKDRGAAGNSCSFLSIAPQLTEEDFKQASIEITFKLWRSWDEVTQAKALRRWAMENEAKFISHLPDSYNALSESDPFCIKELYKDMLSQIAKYSNAQIRNARSPDDTIFSYVKDHFVQYYEETSRFGNVSGSSEAISLSRLLKRQIQLYGQDYASWEEVAVDDQGNVLPYCEYLEGSSPPIIVFQTNGTGHYQELLREQK